MSGAEELARCADAEPFALQVTDHSMAPALPRGSVVVVDPSVTPRDGHYVVLTAHGGPLLRRLTVSDEGWSALREDGDGAPLPVSAGDIIGVVVQSAGRRRHERRRFD